MEAPSPPAQSTSWPGLARPIRAVLLRCTRASLRHPAAFLGCALLLAGVCAWLASGLEVRSSFEELLPSNVPSVRQVKQLIRRVGGDGTVLVSIESTSGAPELSASERMAGLLGKEIQALGPATVRAVEWNVRPIQAWYEDHWPLFLSVAELTQAQDKIDQEIRQLKRRANPLSLGLDDEDQPAPAPQAPVSPWLDTKQPSPREQVAQRFAHYHDGYLVHPDDRSVAILVRPTGTSLSVSEARALLDRIQRLVDGHRDQLRADHLRVGFGGSFPLFVAEYEAILHDVASTAFLCVTLVLLSLFLFFRDLRSTVSLGAAILVAVAVTFGLTRLVIGYLNTQTAFLGSIVVGNGINYGLIYLARVRQLRRTGRSLEEACLDAAPTTARGTLLAALGSSVSFGILILAANRGFRHFGFIGGVGMLLCWLFTFLLVPALLALAERIRGVKPAPQGRTEGIPIRWLEVVFARPAVFTIAFAAAAALSLGFFSRQIPVAIERNLANLTNDLHGQRQLIHDNERANGALGRSVAGAIALLPSWEAADRYCEGVRQRRQDPRYAKVVDSCDTLSNVVPRDQAQRLELIRQIASRLTDTRLALLPPDQRPRVREIRSQLLAQRPVTLAQAPALLVDRFRERDGTLGDLAVITARSDAKLEIGTNLEAFVDAVRNVPVDGHSYDATGENVVFADLLSNIEREGPLTTVGSLVGVCLLVIVFFRRSRASVDLVTSLITGIILMAGVASLLAIKINFFNFIVFPITFGIAVDYGANILVRVQERQGDVLRALGEVGPAVALCSWTSMVGYGSLLLALNRALRSFGWYAIIGEITSILAALLMLPALGMVWGGRDRKRAGRTLPAQEQAMP